MLAEIASGVQAEADEDVLAEAIGLRHAEQSRVPLADRWRAAIGSAVTAIAADGTRLTGIVHAAGEDLVHLETTAGAVLFGLPAPALGLPWVLAAEESGAPPRGLTWGRALRAGLESGAEYRIIAGPIDLVGTIEGVGRDHVDLAHAQEVWTIPFALIGRCEPR